MRTPLAGRVVGAHPPRGSWSGFRSWSGPAALLTGLVTVWRRLLELVADHIEYTTGDMLCSRCKDAYDVAHACPLQTTGHCQDCRRQRLLDRFGNCETCGSVAVTARTFLYGKSLKPEPARTINGALVFEAGRKRNRKRR